MTKSDPWGDQRTSHLGHQNAQKLWGPHIPDPTIYWVFICMAACVSVCLLAFPFSIFHFHRFILLVEGWNWQSAHYSTFRSWVPPGLFQRSPGLWKRQSHEYYNDWNPPNETLFILFIYLVVCYNAFLSLSVSIFAHLQFLYLSLLQPHREFPIGKYSEM